MGALAGLQLAIRHPENVRKLVFAGGAYDFGGWQPEFKAVIPEQTVEMMLQTSFAREYPKLAANPKGFPDLAGKVIALQNEKMAWGSEVKALKVPVLIIGGDADGATLEQYVQMFRLLGGGVMGDQGKALPASRLAILPATSHTAIITQVDLLQALSDPFLNGVAPKSFLQP
jgi:pimeloyl-ACP methyl ester carboxylesterase